jgi:arylsulfatase A-like enzyme
MRRLAAFPLVLGACGENGGDPVATTSSPSPSSLPPQRPKNLLMIVVDDLNDWVGFLHGQSQVRTPAMDALAARSTVFKRAYCNAPVCSPSRASALTGLLPDQTGVFGNDDSWGAKFPSAWLLPNMLAARGFESRIIGKVYHTFVLGDQPLPAAAPATNLLCAGGPTTPPYGLWDWAGTDPDVAHHPDGRYAQAGIDFLGQTHDKPFFLGVGFLRTHVPWYVPQRYFDMYPIDTIQLPYVPPDDLDDIPVPGLALALALNSHACITKQGLWASAVQAYLAAITFVDEQIGRLLAALEASAHADNTLVVLWSDNGYHLGEKFHWHKLALWDRATHVPFLISLPGQKASQTVEHAVSLVDMMPTVLDLLGQSAPDYTFAGRSLRPLLEQSDRAWDFPVITTHQPHDHAVVTDQWRYIRYATGEEELYDIRADPGEFRNIAGDASLDAVKLALGLLMPG